jgi:hypothetical protein
MRSLALVLGAFGVMASASAAEFPRPEQLPSTPGLPDPLTMFDGTKVTTKEQWEQKRKPELKALFEHYMYGKFPPKPDAVTGKVLFEDPKAFNGKGTLSEVALTVGPADWPKIYLLLAVPNNRKGPAPVFVGPNFTGNHTLVAEPRVHLPTVWMWFKTPGGEKGVATDAGRGMILDKWPFEQVLDRGYAVATFYCGDVQPDRPNESEGLRKFLAPPGDKLPGDASSTIATWAWGVQRAVDYLTSRSDLDAKRIAAVGHSRLGKTVLLAAAFDERIAVAIPLQAGCGGTGPSRHADVKAESVKKINTSFPHWFCPNFKSFNDDPSKLPFDQNGLVALCAPRPVLFPNATEDLWANPSGQFEVLKAASPVYRLYGVDGLGSDAMPEVGKLLDSRLGYFIRPGKHAMTPPDWTAFMDFTDKWMK